LKKNLHTISMFANKTSIEVSKALAGHHVLFTDVWAPPTPALEQSIADAPSLSLTATAALN
jgi:hypothetical protein